MSDLPKIVLDCLGAAAPREAHPDADVLSAFAEQALSGAEREGVVRHLARCGECREIVVSSIPPSVEAAARPEVVENETSARATTGRPRVWFAWPNLRWAAVAASVVVVGSVLLLHEKETAHTPGTEELAAHSSAPAPTLDADTRSTAPAPLTRTQAEAPAAKRDTSGMLAMRSGVREERPLGSDRTRTATQSIPLQDSPRKDLATLRRGLTSGANAPAAAPPPPAAADRIASAHETVEVTAAQPQASTETAAAGQIVTSQAAEAVGGVSKSVQSLPMNGREVPQLSPIVKAKPAAKESAAKEKDEVQSENKLQDSDSAADKKSSYGYSPNSMVLLQKQQLKRSTGLAPKWTLSQGKLQRSLDSGTTWQTVLQLGHPLLSFGASGSDVWAGGQSGTLFHSIDSGATWNMLQPATKAGALTADIVAIEVRGASEAILTTSTHESWTTVDTGKTWEKK